MHVIILVVITMSSKFSNDISGGASLEAVPSPRANSIFMGFLNGCNVDMPPVAHPGHRLPEKMSTMSAVISWVHRLYP